MRSKARAPAVGHYTCPNPVHKTPTLAVIRKKNNEAKTLYGFCGGSATEQGCGMTNWNMSAGQEFFLNHGTLWGAAGPPAHLPEWIRQNSAWGPKRQPGAPLPPAPEPVPAAEPPAPVPAPEPEPPTEKPAPDRGFKFPFEE